MIAARSTSADQASAMRSASGSVSNPIARCPSNRDTTTVVPEPAIGSSTRDFFFTRRKRRQTMDEAIRAGNGCTGRSFENLVGMLVKRLDLHSFRFTLWIFMDY